MTQVPHVLIHRLFVAGKTTKKLICMGQESHKAQFCRWKCFEKDLLYLAFSYALVHFEFYSQKFMLFLCICPWVVCPHYICHSCYLPLCYSFLMETAPFKTLDAWRVIIYMSPYTHLILARTNWTKKGLLTQELTNPFLGLAQLWKIT